MFALTTLVPLVAIVASAPVEAAAKEEATAEHTRLAEEMRKLASRNAWNGVEAKYQEMLALEKRGVQLTYDDHMLSAQAAREAGDISLVYDRLLAARARKKTDEVATWLADIESNYGRVELVKDERYVGESGLTVDEMPFAPDQRRAIEAATGVVASSGAYSGILPFGSYTYGGRPFQVQAGGEVVRVVLEPAAVARRDGDSRAGARRRDGFRVDLGPIYTAVTASDAPGVRPEAFSGAGLRAGLGWEIELARNLGMVAEAGYHGMIGGSASTSDAPSLDSGQRDLALDPEVEGYKDSLNLFFVWGGVSYWMGNLAVMAGPSWAGGRARSTGLIANCEDSTAPGCDTVSAAVSEDISAKSPITGSFVKTGGGLLGLYYGFADMPGMRGTRLGVSLYGGAQSDLATLYPWGQLAITIAPGI